MKFLNMGLIVSLSLLLWSCGPNMHSKSEQVVLEKISDNGWPYIKLVDFEVTKEVENNGIYRVDYLATIEAHEYCYYTGNSSFQASDKFFQTMLQFAPNQKHYRNKGDKISVNGTIKFEKTKNGWESI